MSTEKDKLIQELSGKVAAKNIEIEELWELLRKQRELNSELRTQNIILIDEKVKRKIHEKA